jgi:uncharacterized protein YfbU (UPF0304 family)
VKLTPFERLSLVNQFKLLAAADPKEKRYYDESIEALSNGYEIHYPDVFTNIYEGLSEDGCRYVLDVLTMFWMMRYAYDALPERDGIEAQFLEFAGFDSGNEAALMSYAQWFIERLGQFKDLKRPRGFNSPMPTRALYERMLEAWNASSDRNRLTKADLIRITTAAVRTDGN